MGKIYFILLISFVSIAKAQKMPDEQPLYTLYVIGDAGKAGKNPTLELLKSQLANESVNAGVIFLGDNIYEKGLPPLGHKDRGEAENAINNQIDVAKSFSGDVFFIPGNHDWNGGGKKGWEYIQRQEEYVENALDSTNVFYPNNGCSGPIEIQITDQITLIILDTQYFLHKYDKPGRNSSCGAKTPEEAFIALEDILDRNINKKVIIASHHPMYSKGMHGGVVTAKDHFFPLTKLSPGLYIPLPVIGSLFPVYRQTIGSTQDLANLQYKSMVRTITDLMNEYKNIVHLSGHEHALQHLKVKGIDYIVSGSGAKQNTTVKQKEPSLFAGNYHGYGTLSYFFNGEVWLRFYSPDSPDQVVYEKQLSKDPIPLILNKIDTSLLVRDIPTEPQVTNGSDLYEGAKSREFFFGQGYRREWFEGISTPVFNVQKEKGGLTILKKGGGNQTKSLRLAAADGKQYVLRLVEKDATKLIPERFRSNFVKKVVQEGISGSHPYAAYVVPPMAEAVGVYHTNPKLVFIPDDPLLGIYRNDFANKLALFEERPAKDQSDAAYFGYAKKIINTPNMLKKLYKDNDNKVDEQMVLRARLFDMLLGDWDRHDDQWRWAEQNHKGKGKTYQPIPRDRDQVFYVSEGIVPELLGSSWAVPALQGFDNNIKNVHGLWSFAAKYFDRSFMTELTKDDWLKEATAMQSALSDTVIANALKAWPKEIYKYRGDEIYEKLVSRRNKLDSYAVSYYNTLAREVDVVGSNKKEYFEVNRIDDDLTRITSYKISKSGDRSKQLYDRTFKRKETNEIRIYGLGDDDTFVLSGTTSKGIKVRVIGGEGHDTIVNQSKVKGFGQKTLIYDTRQNNEIDFGKDSKDKTSSKPEVNEYNRNSFEYNYAGPILALRINRDDGLFIGAGVNFVTHGFRKEPFKTKHKIGVTNAIATSSYSFLYEGQFSDVVGKANLELNATIMAPNFVTNFFGLGNESVYQQEKGIDYYRVRFKHTKLEAKLKLDLGESINFKFGPVYQSVVVENTQGRFITNFTDNGLDSATLFDRKRWLGAKLEFEIDTRNKEILTEKGIYLTSAYKWFSGVSPTAQDFGKFNVDFRFYYSFKVPSRVTLSNRTGFGQSMGKFEFYQANYLDGHDQLRGYRKYRFGGDRMMYNNTDINIKLLRLRAYILPTSIGVTLFTDVGKVWVEGESSSIWHHGYGGGLWLSPARIMLISLVYGHSQEGWFPTFHFEFSLN